MKQREKGKTITIKINGKRQSFEGTRQDQPQSQESSIDEAKVEKNVAPQQIDHKIETQITSPSEPPVGEETAAAKDSPEDHFDWILPESKGPVQDEYDNEDYDDQKVIVTTNPSQSKSQFWNKSKKQTNSKSKNGLFTKVFTAVFLAVLLGTSIGLSILSLVIVDNHPKDEVTPVNTPITPTKDTSKQPEVNSGTQTLLIPSIKTYVVQGGVFNNKDAAKQIETSLKNNGISALIFEQNGQSVLYLSVADSLGHARELRDKIAQAGVKDPFPKELAFGGKEVHGITAKEKEFIEGFPPLFQSMTIAVSGATSTGAISPATVKSLNQQVEKLGKGQDLSSEKLINLKTSLDELVKKINSKQNGLTAQEVFGLQQQLLTVLAAYQALVK